MRDSQRGMSREQSISVWSLSVYLVLIILRFFFGDYVFELSDTQSFYISRATIDGVSVGRRVSLFYKLCASAIVLFPILFILSKRLIIRFAHAQAGATYLSVTGILLVLSDLMLYRAGSSIKVLSVLLLLHGIVHVVPAFRRMRRAWPSLILVAFLFSAIIPFLFNSSPAMQGHNDTVFLIVLIFAVLSYYILVLKFRISPRDFFTVLCPIALSPLLLFLTVELHFLLKQSLIDLPYKKTFVGLLTLFFVANFFLRKKLWRNAGSTVNRFYAPGALLAFLILIFYQPIVNQPIDMFELANPANAQMRIFHFYEIPFIDFMTSHMMSEQYYGIIYHLFHGFDGSLDFLVFSFFYDAIFYFLAFYYLKKVFLSWVPAILVTLLLPYFNLVFSVHVFYCVIAFLACLNVIKHQRVKDYLLLLLIVVALVVWRLDAGVAALFSTAVFIPLLFFTDRISPSIKTISKALVALLVLLFVSLGIAFLIRSPEYIVENFKVAWHYVAGSQAHGYSNVANALNHQFFIIHFILPFLSLIAVFFSINRLRHAAPGTDDFSLKSSVFFFLIFLFNFPRGLVRHGFLENSDHFYTSSFYLALALLVISFFKDSKPFLKHAVFCVVSFAAVLSIKFFPLPEGKSPIEKFFTEPALMNFDSELKSAEGRVSGSEAYAVDNYAALRDYLNDNLDENQTFLDFSNSPMLYYYCERNIPSYFAQSLQNSIDDLTQFNHLSRLDTNRIPVVVYSHDPPNWFDATDGVLNPMRYYLIAEYIYKYYRPSEIVNGFQIWELKSQTRELEFTGELPVFTPYYDYGHAASIMAEHFGSKSGSIREIYTAKIQGSEVVLPTEVRSENSLFLLVNTTDASNDGYIEVSLIHEQRVVGTMKFFCKAGQRRYMMPLTNHFSWFELSPDRLKIVPSEGVKVESLTIYKDLRGAN